MFEFEFSIFRSSSPMGVLDAIAKNKFMDVRDRLRCVREHYVWFSKAEPRIPIAFNNQENICPCPYHMSVV